MLSFAIIHFELVNSDSSSFKITSRISRRSFSLAIYVVAAIKWKCARSETTRIPDLTNDICGPSLPAIVFAILGSRRGLRSARDIYNFQRGLILPGHVTAMPIG